LGQNKEAFAPSPQKRKKKKKKKNKKKTPQSTKKDFP
jgi:hypothetical protein